MIDIDWTLYAQIINFLLLVFLLNVVLFRPIRKIIRDRQAKLLAQEAEINLLSDQGRSLEDEIKEKLAEARRRHPGGEFIVEDTSLVMDCLNGLPGRRT